MPLYDDATMKETRMQICACGRAFKPALRKRTRNVWGYAGKLVYRRRCTPCQKAGRILKPYQRAA